MRVGPGGAGRRAADSSPCVLSIYWAHAGPEKRSAVVLPRVQSLTAESR
jgi:hypothetical protein